MLLSQDGGKQLLEGMSDNKTLLEFDLRLSDVAQESEYLIGQALCANREEARQRSLNLSHFTAPLTAKGPENPVGRVGDRTGAVTTPGSLTHSHPSVHAP